MAMSRPRSTLEPLGRSSLNYRQSMGLPSRADNGRPSVGQGPDIRKPQGRPSLYNSNAASTSMRSSNPSMRSSNPSTRSSNPSRTSSTGVRKSTAFGPRQDPRPNDKAAVQRNIRLLVDFLTDHNYDQPLSTNIVKRPTMKDFQSIMSFLLRMIDSNFKFTGRLDDQIITLFKGLHYPYPISKASLQAVGTLHTWPALLASIMWLVELLTYDEAVRQSEQQQELEGNDERADERLFFDYLGEAYKAFMDGDDQRFDKLEHELRSVLQGRDQEVEAQCEAIDQSMARMRQNMQDCHDRRAALPGLQQRHADYQRDLGKYRELIEQLNAYREGLDAKTQRRDAELADLQKQLQDVRAETVQLKEVVATQEVSPEDVQRMNHEKDRLKEAMTKATEHKSKMHKTLWEAEMELSRGVVELETAAQLFNSKAAELQLVPITAKNSNGIKYEMVVSKSEVSATAEPHQLLGVDIKGSIRPSLHQVKNLIIEMTYDARKDVDRLLDDEAKSEEEISELLQELATLESKAKKHDEMYRAEKAGLEAKMTERSEELNRVEGQVLQVRSQVVADLEARVTRNQQRMMQLQTDLQIEREDHEASSTAILEAVMATLHTCADHKEHVKRRLGELKEYYVQKRDALLSRVPEILSEPGSSVQSDQRTSTVAAVDT